MQNNNPLLKNKKLPLIMGILNLTPDSFSGDGIYQNNNQALNSALKMIAEGADIIDIGGESTRPFSQAVDINEEIKRVIPILKKLRPKTKILISIDSYKPEVIKQALDCGADIVNDISGLGYSKETAKLVAEYKAYLIIMHLKGTPKDMQVNPQYKNVILEIKNYFKKIINLAQNSGIKKEKIILDPGIGFGKLLPHNIKIIQQLKKFKSLGLPLLVGLSKKSFIGQILNLKNPEDRLIGTLTANVISILNGADILRVHNIKENVEVREMVRVLKKKTNSKNNNL